ncbi:right-handed parallel beta-helix repeat-containing protein, partial [Planctomycetota bacterium]
FVDGRRAPRARHPNKGWLRVEKVGGDRRTNFQFQAGDLHLYRDLDQVEMVFLHDWSITRTPVKSIDPKTRTLTVPNQVGGPTSWGVMDWFEKQPRYYLEGSDEMLDAPGEWCLDRTSGILRYRPLPGEQPDEVEVIAPIARQILVVHGDSDPRRPVRNLHFVGLDVQHAAWAPAGGVYWGRQACTYWAPGTVEAGRSHEEADPAAVQFELADACSFRDGRITHVGASGIWLGRGCRNCRIVGALVADTGGNGVMIGEGQARKLGDNAWWEVAPNQAAVENLVTNSLVERCGQELFGAVGIWVGLAGDTTVSRNEIRLVPYTGVSVGWMWWNPRSRPEPRKTPCRNNVVADNHIHHVMQTLSDGGGIYVLGTQPGSALRGNLIHDVPVNAGRAESNGMFLDQGVGQFVIEENVIYNVDRSPLRFHKGWENLVRNNILEVGEGIPLVRYNDTKTERIKLENNTVVKSKAELNRAVKEAQRRTGPEPEYRDKLEPL